MIANKHCLAVDERLNETLFGTLGDGREELEKWYVDCNGCRPHSAMCSRQVIRSRRKAF
jgi:hypothetical protein